MSLNKIKDPYLKKLYKRLCLGPCGQSAAVLEAREADRKAILELDRRLGVTSQESNKGSLPI